ncbi:MAG: T9SS C-terminal target domain-containing protein [Gemmatimonadetes bacterium]|nr:MAG: T9SS C-terminal target domain-containing protein [Gemmatimonadota bacterium]
MPKIHIFQLSLMVLLVFTMFPAQAQPEPGDIITVPTFVQLNHNWATPHYGTFAFPDSSVMVKRIMLYITIDCPDAGCDPWDRIGHLRVMTSDTTYVEIARYITPYNIVGPGYPGSCDWVYDVTDYQSVLRDSVTLRSYIESWIGGDRGWQITATFEFEVGQPRMVAYRVQNLWQDDSALIGDPADPVEETLTPITVAIDADIDSLKYRMITTGHGQGNTLNAAEFSILWHDINVIDGEDTTRFFQDLWRTDCPQNPCSPQGGTWIYPRAGWCPGASVIPWDVDLTPAVTPGEEYVLDYNIEPYFNECRPTNPDCVDGITCTDCNWNNTGHTPPVYAIQTQLFFYRLTPGGRVSGTITDGEGLPLANIPVQLIGTLPYETTTNDSGFYDFPIVIPGTYSVYAYQFGYEEGSTGLFTIEVDQEVTYDLVMPLLPTGSLDGHVAEAYNDGDVPIPAAFIELLDTPLFPVFTDENGNYVMTDIPIGTYTVRATGLYHLPAEYQVTIPPNGTATRNFELIPIYSFEEDNGNFSGDGDWEWGEPQSSGGPDGAYHGIFSWGTNLDGAYSGPGDMFLISPEYPLGATDPPYELSFYHWYDIRQNWDGGQVQISTDHGENWELITPNTGYDFDRCVGLGQTPGYTGQSDGWQLAQFDLSEYAGENVMFRFWLGAYRNDGNMGWFVDHLVVKGQADINIVDVEPVTAETQVPQSYRLYQNYPNPFNPVTTIRFDLPVATVANLQIYDVQGRLVRAFRDTWFEAGQQALVWDGTNDHGEAVKSGMYLYQLQTPDVTQTKSMVLLR